MGQLAAAAAALELIPACGLTREHQPMSVPKKGRKSVAFSGITATGFSSHSAVQALCWLICMLIAPKVGQWVVGSDCDGQKLGSLP